MVGMVPAASAFQAIAAVAASETAMAAFAASSCRTGPSLALLARRKLARSDPIAAALWRLGPESDGFSWSDHQPPGRSEGGAQVLPGLMDLPGHRRSAAVADPSRNRPGGPKRVAMRNIDSWQVDNSSPT